MATNAPKTVRKDMTSNESYILRIMRDLKEFYNNGINNIHIIPEEHDITVVHALIRGPERTPYENGFFYFVVKFNEYYPIKPPAVKFLTTDANKVRFNPNLYANGKVCLSILGTWTGPPWTPANTLTTVLLSIQSLMNEKPFHNEPGFEERKNSKLPDIENKVIQYNEIIIHETIRVAVIGMLATNTVDARNMPEVLKKVMIEFFKENYQFYEDLVLSKIKNPIHTEKVMKDPFGGNRGKFDYKDLLSRLRDLRAQLGFQTANQSQTTNGTNSATGNSNNNGNDCEIICLTSDSSSESIGPNNNQKGEYSDLIQKYASINTTAAKSEDPENWDALIEEMNMEAEDGEEIDLDYESDSDEDINTVPDQEIRLDDTDDDEVQIIEDDDDVQIVEDNQRND